MVDDEKPDDEEEQYDEEAEFDEEQQWEETVKHAVMLILGMVLVLLSMSKQKVASLIFMVLSSIIRV